MKDVFQNAFPMLNVQIINNTKYMAKNKKYEARNAHRNRYSAQRTIDCYYAFFAILYCYGLPS